MRPFTVSASNREEIEMRGFFRRRVANKMLVAMISAVMLIMGAEIIVRIYFGTRDRIALMDMLARKLASSTYAGIKHPMEMGDAEAIRHQLTDIRETAEDVEVFIFDFAGQIVYSTHEEKVQRSLDDIIHDETARQALRDVLSFGIEPRGLSEDKVGDERFLLYFYPILNQDECHHCHGASRHVLGSMAIRMNAERSYGTVVAQRNRTLVLTLFGVSLVICMIYMIVSRFIRRPVRELVEKAEQFAGGDMTAQMEVRTEDEIGVLAKTFNSMVENVASASRSLQKEVKRKTALLEERTRLISLLERANRELRELDRLKSTFLANMSHELRTPMNAIIGYTDLLIDGVDGAVNEDQKKSLTRIATNSRSLLQLINDILDISKIESGKIRLETKELDLQWLVDSVIPTFDRMLKEKGLTLSHRIGKDLPPIYGDEEAIRRVLINLISNAVKFTDRGGITITARLSTRGVANGGSPIFAEVCVEDTGIGIDDKDLGTIFDKFVQVDLTTVRQREGTGLGLSIARGLIALHKGMIWATSTKGKGSEFCFTLPLKKEMIENPEQVVVEPKMAEALGEYFGKPTEVFLKDPQYAGNPVRCWEYVRCGQPLCPAYGRSERRCWLILGTHCAGMKIAGYPEKVDFCKGCELIESLVLGANEERKSDRPAAAEPEMDTRKTVLAIDDNLDDIDIIRKYLGAAYNVVGLLSGEKAVEKAIEINPIAITLDIMMPGNDGWHVLKQLKQAVQTQDIPVIIVSIVDDKKKGFSLGAAEYIVKPVQKNTLLNRLKTLEKLGRIHSVLVVDDDRETVRCVTRILKEAQYEVSVAYNSQDAISSIGSRRPDLVIVSFAMPQKGGFDVMEYLKTEEAVRDTPLILLAQEDLSAEEINELNGRIQAILNKGTLSSDDLLRRLQTTLAGIDTSYSQGKRHDNDR